MKKLYTLLFIAFAFITNAQIVNIPDANFKAKLLSASPSNDVASTETPLYFNDGSFFCSSYITIDLNGDGEIQISEAQNVRSLNLTNINGGTTNIDITGLIEFTNLENLSFSFNYSTNFIDTNQIPNLKQLIIEECGAISSLNLNPLTNLLGLYVDSYLGNVDLTNNIYLKWLNLNCPLSTINLSNNTELEFLVLNCPLISLNLLSNLNLKNLTLNGLSSGILNLDNNVLLEDLNLNNTNINGLNLTNNILLEEVRCFNNGNLLFLNVTGLTNLQNLYLENNVLNVLTLNNNVNLLTIVCRSNNIQSLDLDNLLNLKNVDCSDNDILSLNLVNLPNLETLNCGYRHYYSDGSSTLNKNNISTIDLSQCPNLQEFSIAGNYLNNLNLIQNNNLVYIDISENEIANLVLPISQNLQEIRCSFNQLVSLDVSLNTHLERLYCSDNQLISLNIKNNDLVDWISYNLNFTNNPNLQYICADEEDVAMVQSKINAYGYASTCHVNSYCSFTPGGTFYTIEGNNRFDGNANGCDSNDFGYPYLKFNITDGTANGNFIANDTGAYFYDVHAATHTMTPVLENPTYFNVSPTTATVDFPTQASPFTQDFCITPNGVHHDLEVIVIPLGVARPGFDASYKIVYKNKGNQLANPVLTFAFDDAVMDYLSASVSATSQSTGLLTWNLGTLAPLHSGNFVVNFNLNAPTETPPLNGGDFLNYTTTINLIATDETPTDNVFILNQTVVNSYDPNDKTCLEGETINPSMIGDYVHYQIRFENTGTFPAQNVVVKDMINTTKFDIATLQMVNTSHSCYTRITGNKVEFIFENINLPFDDATNDGYVVFKIKTLPTLTINSTISNTAEIYFDYNFPIVTNTATSTYQVLSNQDFDFANEFSLYPNPVKNILNINAKKGLEIQSLEIYDTLGQLVIAKPNFEQTIDVSVLPSGTYFIKASTEKGSGSMKFVKQ